MADKKSQKKSEVIVVDIPEGTDLKNVVFRGAGARYSVKASTKYNQDSEKSYEQNVTFDFNGHNADEVLGWAAADRRIAVQRAWRAIDSEEQFEEFMTAADNVNVPAREAGHKPSPPKTPEQIQAEIMALAATLTDEQKEQLKASGVL